MSTPTVRVSETSQRILKELAEQTGLTMTEILDKALDSYQRKVFFERLNAAYGALRADPIAWAESVENERRSMEGCLLDGLDPTENWAEGDLLPPEESKEHG